MAARPRAGSCRLSGLTTQVLTPSCARCATRISSRPSSSAELLAACMLLMSLQAKSKSGSPTMDNSPRRLCFCREWPRRSPHALPAGPRRGCCCPVLSPAIASSLRGLGDCFPLLLVAASLPNHAPNPHTCSSSRDSALPRSRVDGQAEDDGYLASLVYDAGKDKSFLALLDTQKLAQGPICKIWLSTHISHGSLG